MRARCKSGAFGFVQNTKVGLRDCIGVFAQGRQSHHESLVQDRSFSNIAIKKIIQSNSVRNVAFIALW